jgi:hypothetical protein
LGILSGTESMMDSDMESHVSHHSQHHHPLLLHHRGGIHPSHVPPSAEAIPMMPQNPRDQHLRDSLHPPQRELHHRWSVSSMSSTGSASWNASNYYGNYNSSVSRRDSRDYMRVGGGMDYGIGGNPKRWSTRSVSERSDTGMLSFRMVSNGSRFCLV